MGIKLRRGVVRAAAAGAAVLSATLIVGAGVASAAPPADPPGGAVPVPPHFYNGTVEGIRDSGSATTFFMMQKIGDLYTAGGLYGCSIDSAAGQPLYNTSDAASLTTVATTSADLVGGTPTSTIAVNTTTVAIPNGSILYTCRLSVSPDATPGVYPLHGSDLLGSDPLGFPIPALRGMSMDGSAEIPDRALV